MALSPRVAESKSDDLTLPTELSSDLISLSTSVAVAPVVAGVALMAGAVVVALAAELFELVATDGAVVVVDDASGVVCTEAVGVATLDVYHQ